MHAESLCVGADVSMPADAGIRESLHHQQSAAGDHLMAGNDFESLANDQTPVSQIGVRGMVGDLLAEAGITTVSGLVAEFRKPEPFSEVMGIGAVKAAALRRLLLEQQARRHSPRVLVKFLLRRSQLFNYVMIPSIVAIVLLATAQLGYTNFGRDDWFTLLLAFVSLVVFELGHWSCDPTVVRRPWTVGRTRILSVLITLAAIRMVFSENYGWTEAILYVTIGTLLGLLDGCLTWARREAVRGDEPTRKAEQDAAGHLFESMTKLLQDVPEKVVIAIVGGFFGAVAACIAMIQAIVVETIRNWDKIS